MKNPLMNLKPAQRKLIYTLFAAVVIIGGAVGIYFISLSASTFNTDNAKVTAKMYTITAASPGKLLEWDVRNGDYVESGEVLGRQEVLPYLTSPVDGTVVKCDAQAGQTVAPGAQLAVIADTNNMYIGVNIEETKIMKIAVGQDVDVRIDAYKGKVFHGKVTEIESTTQTYFSGVSGFSTSGTYNKVTQLIPVKVKIDNRDNLPMAFGMNASVTIHY
ncbi:MAG: HlyD family efflux transporter periplasmic adaptor subunit [Bacillota bacterium]|nr:HlyD family efflux transporter periplasmic adaptor subunit [Bacillota bacterium]